MSSYTHYFTKNRAPSPQEWGAIEQIALYLIENTPLHSNSAGGLCRDQPLKGALATYEERVGSGIEAFTNASVPVDHKNPNVVQMLQNHPAIIFDGKGDLGSEPFVLTSLGPEIDREIATDLSWCKTNRMPYDLLVCGVLGIFRPKTTKCSGSPAIYGL